MIKLGLVILSALFAFASPRAALSQPMITLEGVVRDATRGGIPGAQVIAVDRLTNERRSALTNERGFFRILDLSPGPYSVSARIVGHAAQTQLVMVVAGERAEIDFLLQRSAGVLETVEVRERAVDAAEIQRLSVSTAVSAQDIQNLPLNTRNVMTLASIAPGIRSFQPVDGRSIPAAGAFRNERGLNLYLDGVEMKNFNSGNVMGSPQTGSPLPADALQEMRVLLNPYDAEFTRGVAYVLSAVSHRGTNERHGSAFGFFQNKNLIAVTDFQRSIPNFEKPDFRRSQLGFSVRGPAVRDRLFYAATYEMSDTENSIAVVPGRPAANPSIWDNYAGVFTAPNRNHTGLVRLTYSANEKNTLEAIWSSRYMTGESQFGGIEARENAVTQNYAVNTVNLRHRWLPASRIANELSLQFVNWAHVHKPIGSGPEFRYPTLTIGRADGFGEIHEKQFRAVDRLTYAIGSGPGSHLLKGGVEISRVDARQYTPNSGRGVFRFRSESAAPFEGLIAVGTINPESDRDAVTDLIGWVGGAYLSDEWHVGSRLVLNLGVRYDAEINTLNNDFVVPWASDTLLASRPELRGMLNRGDRKDDLDNLSPRVSFSWDITGNRRTFVRGGFGILYDRVPGFVAFGEKRNALWRTYSFANPGTLDPAELRRRVISGTGTAVPPMATLLPHSMDVPENRQWSVGLGAQLTSAIALNVDYISQDLENLYASVNLNWLDLSRTPATRVLSSSYGNINAWGDFARGQHRALLTSISYSRDTSLRISIAHTLASSKADWDIDNTSVPARAANEYYEMQRISGDERHRLVLSGRTMLRFGLSISTIATAASPRPYRTQVGQDLNMNNVFEDDWIDGKRYQVPGNTWSNWYRVVDLRITKAISVGRGAQLSLIGEVFNLFNTENYSGYFGVQKSATGELRPDFGLPSGTFATRQFQLGSRLEF
ncbi:MAG TPA: TonB-dependent receptor [Gemmatimonadaceae bacterium]|nr:TonB-dependent receptor [Gemmatimonadaceae bacterium]